MTARQDSTTFLKEHVEKRAKKQAETKVQPETETTAQFLESITADNPAETIAERNERLGIAHAIGTQRGIQEDKVKKRAKQAGAIATKKQAALHDEAEEASAADDAIQAREDEKAAQEAELEEKRKEQAEAERQAQLRSGVQGITSVATQGAHAISQSVNPAIDKIASLRTVGGIGLLLVILAILLFVVVRVDTAGDTRLKQLWYMLSGRAHLQGSVTPSGVTYFNTQQGAGTDFGTPVSGGPVAIETNNGYRGIDLGF